MNHFLALLTSDASLVRCELDRVRHAFSAGEGEIIGTGGWQEDQVVARSYGVGVPRENAWESPDSEAVLLASRSLGVGQGVDDCAQPFRFRRWLFAAGGGLEQADAVRDRLREELPDFIAGAIRGPTWEQAAFARFLAELRDLGRIEDQSLDGPTAALKLRACAQALEQVSAAVGVTARPAFSLVASNGRVIAAVARGGAKLSYALLEGQAACARHELTTASPAAEPPVRDHLRRRSVVLASGEAPGFITLPEGASIAVDRRLNVTIR